MKKYLTTLLAACCIRSRNGKVGIVRRKAVLRQKRSKPRTV